MGTALDLQIWGEVTLTRDRTKPWPDLAPAIERMVRQMTPGDYADLTTPQKNRLLNYLRQPLDNPGFSLALLETLHGVGDKGAMDKVTKLARDEAATPRQKQIRAAARECLNAMQVVHAQEQEAQILLRASDSNTASAPNILLRPVAGTNVASPSDQLLRAVDSEAPSESSDTPLLASQWQHSERSQPTQPCVNELRK